MCKRAHKTIQSIILLERNCTGTRVHVSLVDNLYAQIKANKNKNQIAHIEGN